MLHRHKHKYMNEAGEGTDLPGAGTTPDAKPDTAPAVDSQPASLDDKAPVQSAADQPAPTKFEKVGDPGIDLALDFIERAGVTPDDPAYLAALDGDFDLLRVVLATKGDKAQGWEQVLNFAEKSYKAAVEKNSAAEAAVLSAAHEAAGSAEAWNEIRAWAKQHADEGEKAALNQMMASGPLQAKAAVLYLKSLYTQAPDTTQKPAQVLSPDAGSQPASGGPISPADYKKAVVELSRKLGGRMDGSPEYATLKSRRAAWRG